MVGGSTGGFNPDRPGMASCWYSSGVARILSDGKPRRPVTRERNFWPVCVTSTNRYKIPVRRSVAREYHLQT